MADCALGGVPFLLGLGPEQVGVLRHVRLHLIQVGFDLREGVVLFRQLLNEKIKGKADYLLVHLLDALIGAPLGPAHLCEDLFQVALQGLPRLGQSLPLGGGKGGRLIFG